MEPIFAADQDAKPLLVVVVKATFQILGPGSLSLAEKQLPVNLAGQHWGEPGASSLKYEPEGALFKPRTDVVLIANARGQRNRSHVLVRFRVGHLTKQARVSGDRVWARTLGVFWKTSPKPFDQIPLTYERAFGGWDRSRSNPELHRFEPRNPVGTGFRHWVGCFEPEVSLPNIEDPLRRLRFYYQRPPPVGFGFTSPHWNPRSQFAGTFDDKWRSERMPALPKNFDFRYFNAASPGLIARGYLRGDEPVLVENAAAERVLHFNLPGLPPPKLEVELTGGVTRAVETVLDTVIVNTDERIVLLSWRGRLSLRRGPQDVIVMKALPS